MLPLSLSSIELFRFGVDTRLIHAIQYVAQNCFIAKFFDKRFR